MEQHLGRLLRSDEHVHHLDGNPLNDSVENLEVVSLREHIKLHAIWPKRIDWERVRELRNEGLGCKRIAKLLGCAKSSVCYIFKELGI